MTEFDINYYLHERPPEFLLAVGIAAILVLVWLIVMIPFLAARSMALPLVLFESVPAHESLSRSCRRTANQRLRIAFWLAFWAIGNLVFSFASTAAVVWIGRVALTPSLGSLHWIVLAAGSILGLWLAVNFLTTLVAVTTLAALLSNLYRNLSMSDSASVPGSVTQLSDRSHVLLRSTARTMLVASVIAVATVLGIGFLLINRLGMADHSEIMAHRGASVAAPENTLAAIEQAISDKADWVEIDVQESSDGQVMVLHDSDLKKIGGSPLKPWQSTAEQLRVVDIGSWFDKQFGDQRVPTLDEALALCKNRIKVNIELKYYGYDQRLEERVIELVKAHDMSDDVVIMSLKKSGVDKFKQLEPTWPAGLLTATAVGDITRADVDFLAVNVSMATRRFITNVQKQGKQVFVWTVNDPLTMSTMMSRGVDAIITDDPALARRVQRQRAQMNLFERLLAELAAIIGTPAAADSSLEDV